MPQSGGCESRPEHPWLRKTHRCCPAALWHLIVDCATRQPVKAKKEHSDTCVVSAAGVIAEARLALVLAHALTEKFGGDSMASLRDAITGEASRLRTL